MTRILLVTSLPPWPTKDGGRQRTNLLHRALSRCGTVDTALISRTEPRISDDDMAVLKDRFNLVACMHGTRIGQEKPWRLLESLSPSLPDRLAHTLGGWQLDFRPGEAAANWLKDHLARQPYDLLVGRYLWTAAHAGMIGRHPLIVDVDDLESQLVEAQAMLKAQGGASRWWWHRRVRQIAAAERKWLARVDHAWLTKRQDMRAVDASRASLLPNVPFIDADAAPQPLPPQNSRRVLFVGSLDFATNVRAIDRYLDRVWPGVRGACPDAEFVIVGNRMHEADRARWSRVAGVRPLGFVDDVRDAYHDAAFSVVPVWDGAGTKIKVLESLMFGRTVAVARHSLTGYEDHLADGRSVMVADDDTGMARACIALLDDPARRAMMAAEGHAAVSSHYSTQSFFTHVADTVGRVLGGINAT